MHRKAALTLALIASAGACAAPPKTIKLAPARVPSPQIRALEADAARVRPWKLVAARDIAGVLFEEYQLGDKGPKLALAIDGDARVVTIQAHFASLSKTRIEDEAAQLAKAVDPIGAIAGGAVNAERAYLAVTFSPKIEAGALELAAKSIVRPRAVYSASGAIERVPFLAAMKAAFEVPGPKDSVASERLEPIKHSAGVFVAWPVDNATPAEEVALEAAARVLADGPESRLGRALLSRDARSIEATSSGRAFEIAIALEPGRTSTAATSLVDREVRALARGETTGIEVETARSRVRAKFLFELSALESRAALAGGALLQHGGVAGLFARYESTEKLDEKMMRAAVAKHLKPSMVSTR